MPTTHPLFDIEHVIAGLTLEEKAALTSGANFWETKAIERLGVPAVILTDGPHGLRLQAKSAEGLTTSENLPATCFPTAAALGSTWDVDLLRRVGQAMGRETRAAGVAVILGPGVNIKRHPLCGRNFEYVSEDPVVAGQVGAALVAGIQSEGVGASVKHFAANNQETDRMRVSAEIDQRTLREIYFPAFEYVVRQAAPWTVMCSYNKINGTYSSANRWLLTDILRGEWGYEGLVVSDWGAVVDRAAAVAAGLDLEMPGTRGVSDADLVEAVRAGRLDEAVLDQSVRRVLALVRAALPALADPGQPEHAAHHALAHQAAVDGTVLLKNDPVEGKAVLPLAPATRLAVIGEMARTPRYQGAGSSLINPTQLDDALTSLERIAPDGAIDFKPGYLLESDGADEAALRAEAVQAAGSADAAVVFLGLPAADESEGYDRPHWTLPSSQIALLQAVAAVQPRTAVILSNGSAIDLSWRDQVPAICEGWLGGQAGGSAVADIIYGLAAPGGRLTETIPLRLEDTPAYGNFPGEFGQVRYGEGVLVGYRWYDYRALEVAYPFGHGLSYTSFEYSDLAVEVTGTGPQTRLDVSITITNTGSRAGAEVVQVYLADPEAAVIRPPRELKGFAKVRLEPGQSERVTTTLTAHDLEYWHPLLRRWVLEPGQFTVAVGASSRDLRAEATVTVQAPPLDIILDANSTLGEWESDPVFGPQLLAAMGAQNGYEAAGIDEAMVSMITDMPLRVIVSFNLTSLRAEALDDLVAAKQASLAS